MKSRGLMMYNIRLRLILRLWKSNMVGKNIIPVIFILFSLVVLAGGQSRRPSKGEKPPKSDKPATAMSKAREDLVAATKNYKESLEKLIPFEQDKVKTASETVQRRRELLAQGVVSKHEVEVTEQQLADAQAKLAETQKKMAEADTMMAEAMNDQLWKVPDLPRGGYRATAALIRYNGPYDWSLKDAGKVETFYESRFGRSLPISAYGQTMVHNELGFDHRHAIDIALQPDSPEGQALMAYLRGEGIPFIAFRHAVPGSATGAHIHIGPP